MAWVMDLIELMGLMEVVWDEGKAGASVVSLAGVVRGYEGGPFECPTRSGRFRIRSKVCD